MDNDASAPTYQESLAIERYSNETKLVSPMNPAKTISPTGYLIGLLLFSLCYHCYLSVSRGRFIKNKSEDIHRSKFTSAGGGCPV